jgi:site-specific DNA-cytosine methylase
MNIIGICGGNGVILYAMKRHIIANYEPRSVFHTPDNIQWELNFGDIPLITSTKGLADHFAVDVIVGAPNCGHSSMLSYSRKKSLGDPKADESLTTYIRGVKLQKPKVFLMENLPKILELITPDEFKESFPDYELIFNQFSVIYWGNSQKTRKRLLIIGIHKAHFRDHLNTVRDHFLDVYKVNKIKTCRTLLHNLPENGHIRESIDDVITMYSGFKISLREVQQFWLDNPTLKRWPAHERNFTTAPAVYRNLANDYPAVARKANRQFNSQGLQMSPRELARIQGLPDTFKIYTDNNRKTFSINKGRTTVTKTPPYEISRWFYKQLLKIKPWM